MTEYFIPFLLVSQLPVNKIDVYGSPQYVFNWSQSSVTDVSNLTSHLDTVASIKCQNSGISRLICQFVKPRIRLYREEGPLNIRQPRYMPMNCNITMICKSFEINFDQYGVKEMITSRNLSRNDIIFIKSFADLLDISWIDFEATQDKSIKPIKNQSRYGKCDAVAKITRKKDKNYPEVGHFEINSVKGLDGMAYFFKKTSNVTGNCSNWYSFYEKDNLTIPKLKSFVHRVTVSVHEFVSTIDQTISHLIHQTLLESINRDSLILDSIESTTEKLSPVTDPIDNINFE